ncbi:MAG TPA: LLM class flavin-dependent oxidoreductase [Thermoanaerobaculia bacterium]|nr:LLM class flavin-dependent oxidoreductase [Thermoanaerobaculia bacterium]
MPRLHLGTFPWRQAGIRGDEDRRGSSSAQARRAERLGFGSFWLPESHFGSEARPAPLLELAAAAAVTKRLRLGVTSYLLPIRHPLLVAEEVAVLDRLSGGRLILGLGRGFRPDLFAAFGVDRADKRELFETAVETMLRAWRGDRVGGSAPGIVEIHPRPLQQPHPPLWVAAFGPKALRQAARLGLPYLASPLEPFDRLRRNIELHRAELLGANEARDRLASTELPVPILRTVFVSRSRGQLEAAQRGLEPEIARWRRMLAELGGDEERSSGSTVGEHALLGGPDDVAGKVERYRRELGMTHLIVRSPRGPGAAAVEASLRELPRLLV